MRRPALVRPPARRRSPSLSIVLVAVLLASCSGGGPILANPPAARPSPPTATEPPIAAADPLPVVLPRDDAPHDRLTEWWYYTGHLRAADGRRFGFEYVIFRAERGAFPTSWVSHLAITDEAGDRFLYGQRLEVGPGVDRSPTGTVEASGFDLAIAGSDPGQLATSARSPWTMTGADGDDHLGATFSAEEAVASGSPGGLGLDLSLRSTKPPALHGGLGWIDFGPAGSSYYYSRTAMTASGTLLVDGEELSVRGNAWFDHQWGDFISVGGGGWDWFAVNLDDGTDLTLSLVRDVDGSYPLIYGTVVAPDGGVTSLRRDDFTVAVTARWTSPATSADYPAGWTIEIPGDQLTIRLRPTVAAQELDTRATTGVVYWEGSQLVEATRAGSPLGGEAYVELTGYATAGVAGR
jgi:predicted secreted hydrolase